MSELQLTPSGHLRWFDDASAADASVSTAHKQAFAKDWRAGLFALAAQRTPAAIASGARWWQSVAEAFITALCHIPAESAETQAAVPAHADLERWISNAPPMPGGEYLSVEVLLRVWDDLNAWLGETLGKDGLQAFIEARAPKWRQVGRVCFHLAENKADPERPFAFMATFTTGLGADGRPRHLPLGKALEQYAGARNRAALVRLLTPVEQAAQRCDWVRAMVVSGELYQPTAWPPVRAHRFLLSATELEACGLSVRLPDWWKARPRPQVRVSLDRAPGNALGMEQLLKFDVGVALGGEILSKTEIEALLAGADGLVQIRGRWVELDRDKLQQALSHWRSVRKQARDGTVSFIEGMRLLAGAPADLAAPAPEAERNWVHVEAGAQLAQTLAALRQPARLEGVDAGAALQATLRPYQHEGVNWLSFLAQLGLGACLADDMGLGKTIQVLALLLHLRRVQPDAKPSLLVVPASLLGNWRAEAQRFAPSLKLQFLHPAEVDAPEIERIAAAPGRELHGIDLAITTYSMLHRQEWLQQLDWNLVVLDEAQAIKNAGTRQSRAVKQLSAQARVALTGTPIENRLGDLWSLFDFINPGLLGSASVFKAFVKRLDERTENAYAPLRQLVAPYILRRMKTDRSIISDLPPKTETQAFCALSRTQAALYQKTVDALRDALQSVDGIARRGLVLQTLMRLKQVCNHPSQLSGDGAYASADSGKFQRLAELCEEMAERQQRVLVFTQFREMVDPLERHLAGIFGCAGLCLHGGTAVAQRGRIVEQFQSEEGPPFMVLSLKAGGTGLNLTAASQVIHFDRWWNPAVENQATDRAFRIGQTRAVLVHKFVTRGTVEERIDAMIADKRALADELLEGGAEVKLTELPDAQLLDLVRLDVNRALT